MKRFGGLWENIVSFNNLVLAAHEASKSKRDNPRVQQFLFHLEPNILELQAHLISNEYQPGPYSCFTIYEPKRRKICAAPFVDRIVHHAICRVMNPYLERIYVPNSYACRTNKGMHKAVDYAQDHLKRYKYFLKCDISKFFESVHHNVLKDTLKRKFKDRSLLLLLDCIVDHPVPDNEEGKGLPIGNLTSQHFANYLLTGMDIMILQEIQPGGYIRYMDDFVLFSMDKPFLHEAHSKISHYLTEQLRLKLKTEATIVGPAFQGLPFLGFHLFPSLRRLKRTNWIRFTKKFHSRYRAYVKGEITEESFIRSSFSLFGHVRHADSFRLLQSFCDRFEWI